MNAPPASRWEWKVLLTPAQAREAAAFARAHLAPDPFGVPARDGGYLVTSTYLGPGQEARGPRAADAAAHHRVRRYGADAGVWLERKENRGGRVVKLRAPADAATAEGPAERAPAEHPGRAWLSEVEALGLVPRLIVSYVRAAWFLPGSTARLTIDRGLTARPALRRVPDDVPGGVPLTEDCVLELKFDDAPPEAFQRLLRAQGLAPHPWSKRRAALRALRGRPRFGPAGARA